MTDSLVDVMDKLEENKIEIYEETTRILIKIADNILKDPSNMVFRTIKKTNPSISSNILKVKGGLDCLKAMGFEEDSLTLTLPILSPLNKVEAFREIIHKRRTMLLDKPKVTPAQSSSSSSKETNNACSSVQSGSSVKSPQPIVVNPIKPIVLPPLKEKFKNEFLQEIERHFHNALVYGMKSLQRRALDLIPVFKLKEKAKTRLRSLHESMKIEKLEPPPVELQDMLILELLAWFKEEFFTWVDNPPCKNCGEPTKFSYLCTDKTEFLYTARVEMHKCETCNVETPFARYNDLNILMATRKGRCGEWANTFTLFCKAMGWDARIVFDQNDHVWTEVYSHAQRRWLHCDSCENACDKPLIYEAGWGKKFSYIIAYSDEEVQDVTWRYSAHHKEVTKRRLKCTEEGLAYALEALREERQKNFSKARKLYLQKRCLFELVELMVEPKASKMDEKGRISGSSDWKQSRGETKVGSKKFSIGESPGPITIRYSTALDMYETIVANGSKKELHGWNLGIFEASNVFRKEEKDWKQVYLCRTETSSEGKMTWYFEVKNPKVLIDMIALKFDHKIFENGMVSTVICSEETCLPLESSQMNLKTSAFSGSSYVKITTTLSGGHGDNSWQHAQIFRQASDSKEFPFVITFTFKDK